MSFMKIMKGHMACSVCQQHSKGLLIRIIGKSMNEKMCLSCLSKAQVDPDAAVDYEAWKSKYREVFDDTATKWKLCAEQQRREGREFMEYLKKFTPTLLQAGQKVLDVGCSICGFLSMYKEHGWEVYGVEPNPILTKYAQQIFGIDAQTAFYSPRLFPREYFDLIIG